MSKLDKKRAKLTERIEAMETELRIALQKKNTSAVEIDVPGKMRRIAEMKAELAALG